METRAKSFIVEDSSFVIAIIDLNDEFHKKAVTILEKINGFKDKVIILLPEIVIFETVITLIRKGIKKDDIELSLKNLFYIDNIRCISIPESSLFRFCKNVRGNAGFSSLKTSDYLIASIAKDYSAAIITFDLQMRKNLKPTYSDIYCCEKIKDLEDETESFLNFLKKFIFKIMVSCFKGNISKNCIPSCQFAFNFCNRIV